MSNFKKFTRTLIAGQVITIDTVGSTICCTAGDAVFYVEPNSGNKVEFQLGLSFTNMDSASLWTITNGPTAQTIDLYIGDGQILDNRLVGNVTLSGGIKTAGNTGSSYATVSVGTSAQLVKAAETTRSNILVQNTDSSATIYVATDASVTAANGIKILAGADITLTTSETIYAISDTAATDVRYLSEVV